MTLKYIFSQSHFPKSAFVDRFNQNNFNLNILGKLSVRPQRFGNEQSSHLALHCALWHY